MTLPYRKNLTLFSMILLFFLTLFSSSNALKILVYNPKFAHSHVQFMGKVADTLAEHGHQVVVLQPEVHTHVVETGSRMAEVISVKQSEETWENRKVHNNDEYWEILWSSEFDPRELLYSSWMLKQLFNSVANNVLSQKELLKSLEEKKFDVMLTELLDFTGLGLSHLLRIPSVIGVSSLGILEGTALAIGSPLSLSHVPASHGIADDSGSFWARLTNLVYSYYSYHFQEDLAAATQGIFRENGYSIPNIWDIVSEMPLVISNSDPLLDFPRPTLHKIVDIGGFSLRDPQHLTAEYEEILSLRPRTVLISFGSIAFSSKMPQIMKNSLVKTVERFPNVTFILKYEEPENGPKSSVGNLILKKWFPQNDLLADPRVILFVTHGGVASTYEAASHGVPMLFVPSFGDQMRNAQMIQRLGFGKIMWKNDLRREELVYSAIRYSLENEKMMSSAKQTKELLKNRPFSPSEILVKHVELAGKFKYLAHLSPSGRKFNVFQYYNIDILAMFCSFSLFLATCISFICSKYVWK